MRQKEIGHWDQLRIFENWFYFWLSHDDSPLHIFGVMSWLWFLWKQVKRRLVLCTRWVLTIFVLQDRWRELDEMHEFFMFWIIVMLLDPSIGLKCQISPEINIKTCSLKKQALFMPGRSVSETLLLWFFVDLESPFDLITSVWCHVDLFMLHLRFRKYGLLVKVRSGPSWAADRRSWENVKLPE